MNRHIHIFHHLCCLFAGLAMLVGCGHSEIQITNTLNEEVAIFPDYKDITIPINIAPLNFSMEDSSKYCLLLKGKECQFQVRSKKGLFDIPKRKWKTLLKENAEGEIELTIAKKTQDGWSAYSPFHMEVAKDSISPYIAYRLIFSNAMWNKMGIYQRNLENYKETAIFENSLSEYNCMNCHTFQSRNPDKLFFHMRGGINGSVLIDEGKITKLITKTPETFSNFVYIFWHPSGDYLAATTCKTGQNIFINNPNIVEIQDENSDIVIYDFKKNEIFSCDALNSEGSWNIYPAFSPDGESLYYCSTAAIDSVLENFQQMTYSLCRIDFDPETGTLGQQVDTLYNGSLNQKSVSFPRVSPDGKYLAFTLQEYGAFGVWHKDADLYMVRLADGEIYPLTDANSPDNADSYHSWSGNSHWLVYSSRRVDGVTTRPYFTYIDDEGVAHKPFLLPQKNPKKYYQDLLMAYNVPEFIEGKVQLDKHAVLVTMRDTKGTQVQVR